MTSDPILLASQARPMLEKLHLRSDVVVKLKTDSSGYAEDALDDFDREAPGHFQPDAKVLTLSLDALLKGRPAPESLATIEDWRKHPVLAGVAAHESAHARFSLWDSVENPLPESIPNPDYDPSDPESGPESFKVSGNGRLREMASLLEEPRVERLGVSHFSKTWRRAMQHSAAHLVLEQTDAESAQSDGAVDKAVAFIALVGGRQVAGTVGQTFESRQAVRKVLKAAEDLLIKALPDSPDAYFDISAIVTEAVYSNKHEDSAFYLECARRILSITHPESKDDPDGGSGGRKGEGEDEGKGGSGSKPGEGEGEGSGEGEGEAEAALRAMSEAMSEAMDKMVEVMAEETRIDAEQDMSGPPPTSGGHGAVLYDNPRAPQVSRHEQPTADDRALYKRARDWMEAQIEPTITQQEVGQWLPTGGARLDVRAHVRDNLAGHRANQRSDWGRVSETVKPAPPVKVAIMLDGSGSMSSMARPSASIAWAAANAAADLPESRTVSVVYGNAAAVTQPPGHQPAKTLAVSRTDGGMEDFDGAVRIVEEALRLDEPTEDDQPTNVLIVIVSDLRYGGSVRNGPNKGQSQMDVFIRTIKEWGERGYQILVVGAGRQIPAFQSQEWAKLGLSRSSGQGPRQCEIPYIEIVEPGDLFR